jgi:hypothetical protein
MDPENNEGDGNKKTKSVKIIRSSTISKNEKKNKTIREKQLVGKYDKKT